MTEDLRVLFERAEVPGCDECNAFGENPKEFVESEICPACPWSREVTDERIHRLLHHMDLLDAGCPVGRHELADPEWIALGVLKAERQRLIREKVEAAYGKTGQ